jgi:hypothetical protein
MLKLQFSGHETFICKNFWPKKGIDFLLEGYNFNDEDAVVKLGVGKNMVASIRFWLKALDLVNENEYPTELARMIFEEEGFDPYIEDIGTIWLLHYFLVTTQKASIYSLVFNEFTKEKNSFTKRNLHSFLKRLTLDRQAYSYNEKTFDNDIGVFFRNYLKPSFENTQNIEEDFISLFSDLNLIKHEGKRRIDTKIEDFYTLERTVRFNLPLEIIQFAILSNLEGNAVSLTELSYGHNSIGNIFLLSRDALTDCMQRLAENNDYITYSQSGGIQVLYFEEKPQPNSIIQAYYGK